MFEFEGKNEVWFQDAFGGDTCINVCNAPQLGDAVVHVDACDLTPDQAREVGEMLIRFADTGSIELQKAGGAA
jgi:hypothetical protein